MTGQYYSGTYNRTRSGKPCIKWTDLILAPGMNGFLDGSLEGAVNYCRNPNNRPGGPWCYIDEGYSWEYCPIELCTGNNKIIIIIIIIIIVIIIIIIIIIMSITIVIIVIINVFIVF